MSLGLLILFSLIAASLQYDAKDFAICGKSVKPKHRAFSHFTNSSSIEADYVKKPVVLLQRVQGIGGGATPPICCNGCKVMGGSLVPVGVLPWMAKVEVQFPAVRYGLHCSGFLISKDHVMTSAHCFLNMKADGKVEHCKKAKWDKMKIIVNVGATNLKPRATMEERGVLREVKNILMDEKYYSSKCSSNDMLSSSIPVDLYPPICLLDRDQAATKMGNLDSIVKDAYVSGYGHTPADNNKVLYQAMIAPVHLCMVAGVPRACTESINGKAACCGDSGGPLSVLLNGRYYAYGIVENGQNCHEYPVKSSVYARLNTRMFDIRRILK